MRRAGAPAGGAEPGSTGALTGPAAPEKRPPSGKRRKGHSGSVVILDHVGIGELLEPVIMAAGRYPLCEFNPGAPGL